MQRGDLVSITRAANRRADALTDPSKTDEKNDDKEKDDAIHAVKKEVGLDEAIDKRTD